MKKVRKSFYVLWIAPGISYINDEVNGTAVIDKRYSWGRKESEAHKQRKRRLIMTIAKFANNEFERKELELLKKQQKENERNSFINFLITMGFMIFVILMVGFVEGL